MSLPIPAGGDEDPTAAVTVVEAEDRVRALESTEELLDEIPGARTQHTGGLGSFAGLSIRGADLDHTSVLFDQVPLTEANGAPFDLAAMPLQALERVEVYRGGAPFMLGASGIGGVVRLVPRSGADSGAMLSLGAGSFGLRSLTGLASVTDDRGATSWLAVAGLRHSDGDYPYLDDGGTRLVQSDDVERRRQNGKVDEGWGLGHLSVPLFGGTMRSVLFGRGRTGGLSGSPIEEPTRTRRTEARATAVLQWDVEGERPARGPTPWRVSVTASAAVGRDRVSDRLGELGGLPTVTDDRTYTGFARIAGQACPSRGFCLSALSSYRFEDYRPRDGLAQAAPPGSTRHTVLAGAEAQLRASLGSVRGELRPSASLLLTSAQLYGNRLGVAGAGGAASVVEPVLRVALVVEPLKGLALSASAASAVRLPSLVELFGNGALLLGDASLRPERSTSFDVGAVVRASRRGVSVFAELRAFALLVDDLVRYVRTSQFQLVPQNVDHADVLGAELGGRVSLGQHFGATAALTVVRTRDRALDRELPFRPPLEVYLRPEVRLARIGSVATFAFYVDVTHVASNFLDPHNQVTSQARTLFGAGVVLETLSRRLRLSLSARDLTDERPQDIVGFPLAGRSFALDLTLQTERP